MGLFEKTVEFVNRSFGGCQAPHFGQTVHWLKRFYPAFEEAHIIAAYAHDIERAFCDKRRRIPESYLDHKYLRNHQEKGAQIIAEFLRRNEAPDYLVEKVVHLVSRHEVGGDKEQNALMDADSASFFETNVEMFVKEKAPREGYEKIKAKVDWMFNRIDSGEAKEITRPIYEKWTKVLNESLKIGHDSFAREMRKAE